MPCPHEIGEYKHYIVIPYLIEVAAAGHGLCHRVEFRRTESRRVEHLYAECHCSAYRFLTRVVAI